MNMDLSRLAEGAVQERINEELQKVAQNIMDPNTEWKKVRKVTLTISVSPDESREIGLVGIEAKSSLAPAKGIATTFMFGTSREGKAVANELVSGVKNQLMIDNDGDVADDAGKKLNLPQDKVVQFK